MEEEKEEKGDEDFHLGVERVSVGKEEWGIYGEI